jgi:hypothetical protein
MTGAADDIDLPLVEPKDATEIGDEQLEAMKRLATRDEGAPQASVALEIEVNEGRDGSDSVYVMFPDAIRHDEIIPFAQVSGREYFLSPAEARSLYDQLALVMRKREDSVADELRVAIERAAEMGLVVGFDRKRLRSLHDEIAVLDTGRDGMSPLFEAFINLVRQEEGSWVEAQGLMGDEPTRRRKQGAAEDPMKRWRAVWSASEAAPPPRLDAEVRRVRNDAQAPLELTLPDAIPHDELVPFDGVAGRNYFLTDAHAERLFEQLLRWRDARSVGPAAARSSTDKSIGQSPAPPQDTHHD